MNQLEEAQRWGVDPDAKVMEEISGLSQKVISQLENTGLVMGIVGNTVRTLELITSGAMAKALDTRSRRSCWAVRSRSLPAQRTSEMTGRTPYLIGWICGLLILATTLVFGQSDEQGRFFECPSLIDHGYDCHAVNWAPSRDASLQSLSASAVAVRV